MNNEELKKKIEEIEKVVGHNCNKQGIAKHCPERISNGIYSAGYRKASDVIDELVKNIMTEAEPFLSNMSRNLIRMCASKMKKALAAEMRQEVEK